VIVNTLVRVDRSPISRIQMFGWRMRAIQFGTSTIVNHRQDVGGLNQSRCRIIGISWCDQIITAALG
jgi:hypothetical protein